MSWDINEEQRVTLRLSQLANAVLEEEMAAYRIEKPSTLVCPIFDNYYLDSPASIGRTLERREEELTELLQDEGAVKRLLRHERQQLVERCSWEKGDDRVGIRLQNRTYAILNSCRGLEEKYHGYAGVYLRAVLEDYFRLPPVQRQRIYFAPLFAQLESAIARKLQLRVETESGSVFLMHPCMLQTDTLSNNWYLAGFTRREEEGIREKQPASFRVSGIAKVTVLEKHPAVVSVSDRKELEKLIAKRGVQFLVEKTDRILVAFTERGLRQLGRMTSLRPVGKPVKGNVWEFHCTQTQARRYFVRMGAECEILEPAELRQQMAEDFKAAAEKYQK